MIRSDHLPEFIFTRPSGETLRLRPGERTARIQAIAARIARDAKPGDAVGLMFPSGPDLVLAWLACVVAGVQPLVMQYPTKKQTRQYWENSVTNTIGVAGLKLVLCDSHCAALGLSTLVPIIEQAELETLKEGAESAFAVFDFSIIQLSSGTTGHRKAVQLTGAALLRHVMDYNRALNLTNSDRIVSWLPLYHDMGYVACFVMPLMLGIDVIMMDPIDWVKKPGMLYDAIEAHGGTICYQPNFGFEVMAREPARALPGMRKWISCSEPVSAITSRKFLAAIGAPEDRFAACYAMAENVFAVTISTGIETRTIDGAEVMSCGAPIPGVELKIVDHEIWARSPTSLTAYMGGADIRDADGFYPTGDLGELIDGALYVTGRKQDLMIQAGRKFMLSDIDLLVNRLFPDIRGRAAAIAMYDARLGTQMPVMLIESADFFERRDQADIAEAVREAMTLDQIEVAFVPPRFLTKTSSGKINRKLSGAHWAAVLQKRRAGSGVKKDPVAELRESFPRIARDRPVAEVLDSLSLTVLRIILQNTRLTYDGTMSLDAIAAALAQGQETLPAAAKPEQEGLRIVSLVDRHTISRLNESHIEALSQRLGCPVTLEHVCLPPSPVILSDLIFSDYFAPRIDADAMSSIEAGLDRLRNASLILVDDAAEMRLPPNQAYAVLSHNLERDPRTDLITVRWQHYARLNHRLPMTFVSGRDLPLDERGASLDRLSAYLGKKLYRIASHAGLKQFTEGWEFLSFPGTENAPMAEGLVRPQRLVAALADWIKAQPEKLPLAKLRGTRLEFADLGHFCSHFANRPAIDQLLAAYDSFCIAGQESSIPYIRDVLTRAGKRFSFVPSFAPEILATVEEPFDCLLICGAWGDFEVTTPAAAVMFVAYGGASTFNISDPKLSSLTFKRSAALDPESASDWFYPGKLHRTWPIDVWAAERASRARKARVRGSARPGGKRGLPKIDARAEYEDARRALEKKPGDARALATLSKAARALGNLPEARSLAEQTIAAAPELPVGYRLLVAIAMEQGDRIGAAAACARGEEKMADGGEEFARLSRRVLKAKALAAKSPAL
jgi:acyl-CoA synthetase (AMP-forming)/AMP-acid ligase II